MHDRSVFNLHWLRHIKLWPKRFALYAIETNVKPFLFLFAASQIYQHAIPIINNTEQKSSLNNPAAHL